MGQNQDGEGPELKPLITEQDKELLRSIGEEIHRIGQTERAMDSIRVLEGEEVTEQDKERTLCLFREQQAKRTETLDNLLQKIAPGYAGGQRRSP